jgi:C-terminal processing protease CtpA/Prc
MKAKYVPTLVAAIILTAGLALAQDVAPPTTPQTPEDFGNTFSFFVDGGGFLGVYGEDITNDNIAKYHLSQARGVGITQIVADSPAAKAGLRKDDVILRIDGENVTSVRKLNRLVSEIAPDHNVRITISRNGSEQEISATMGKRKDLTTARDLFKEQPKMWKWEGPMVTPDKMPNFPNFNDNNGDLAMVLGNSRRIGVSTMELSKQLADYFGIAGGRGVLVTAVSDDGPAAKSGVKAGDVITAVDGEAVDSPGDIARLINRKKDGDVTLTIVRNKSRQTIRVTPRQGSLTRTINDQVGRQIVIPRIQFPDLNIEVPAIDIQIPRVRINPGAIRVSRTVRGPI